MNLFLITYQFKKSEEFYRSFYDKIKKLCYSWWHYLDTVWIIRTDVSIQEISATLNKLVDTRDCLLIVDVTVSDFSGWLPTDAWQWIKNNKFEDRIK